jgi:hypothetical protein
LDGKNHILLDFWRDAAAAASLLKQAEAEDQKLK